MCSNDWELFDVCHILMFVIRTVQIDWVMTLFVRRYVMCVGRFAANQEANLSRSLAQPQAQ